MRQSRTSGSVRGAAGNRRPYRDPCFRRKWGLSPFSRLNVSGSIAVLPRRDTHEPRAFPENMGLSPVFRQ